MGVLSLVPLLRVLVRRSQPAATGPRAQFERCDAAAPPPPTRGELNPASSIPPAESLEPEPREEAPAPEVYPRGSESPRVAMMLRWISDDPPAIVPTTECTFDCVNSDFDGE